LEVHGTCVWWKSAWHYHIFVLCMAQTVPVQGTMLFMD